MKIAFVSFILALAPVAGSAMCSEEHINTSASNCATGQHWDAEKLACVPTISS
jgi:hypothetical protein